MTNIVDATSGARSEAVDKAADKDVDKAADKAARAAYKAAIAYRSAVATYEEAATHPAVDAVVDARAAVVEARAAYKAAIVEGAAYRTAVATYEEAAVVNAAVDAIVDARAAVVDARAAVVEAAAGKVAAYKAAAGTRAAEAAVVDARAAVVEAAAEYKAAVDAKRYSEDQKKLMIYQKKDLTVQRTSITEEVKDKPAAAKAAAAEAEYDAYKKHILLTELNGQLSREMLSKAEQDALVESKSKVKLEERNEKTIIFNSPSTSVEKYPELSPEESKQRMKEMFGGSGLPMSEFSEGLKDPYPTENEMFGKDMMEKTYGPKAYDPPKAKPWWKFW